jgi:hypothetical protein
MQAVRENILGRKKRKKNSWNNPSQRYCDLTARLRINLMTIQEPLTKEATQLLS